MRFVTTIIVHKDEAPFLLEELKQEMPLKEGDTFTLVSSMALGAQEMCLENSTPLSLAQRRFLVACGLKFACTAKRS